MKTWKSNIETLNNNEVKWRYDGIVSDDVRQFQQAAMIAYGLSRLATGTASRQ